MNISEPKYAKSIFAGVGISSLYLDCSSSTPRIRLPESWAKRIKEILNWRVCYLGTGKLALVPIENWEQFCCITPKAFKRENPNKDFNEWVCDFAKDTQLNMGKIGARIYIPLYLLEWAKIPVNKGTILYLYPQNVWLVLSLTGKPGPSVSLPDSSGSQPLSS